MSEPTDAVVSGSSLPAVPPAPAPLPLNEDLATNKSMPDQQVLLRIKQQQVLGRMMDGESVAAAARFANLDRSTVFYWMKRDPAFMAAVRAWRERFRNEARDQIMLMTTAALRTVRTALTEGNIKVATDILKSQGLLDKKRRPRKRAAGRPPGSFDPNVVMEHSQTRLAMVLPSSAAAPAPVVSTVPPPQAVPSLLDKAEMIDGSEDESV